MLKQIEAEVRRSNYRAMIVDARVSQRDVMNLLAFSGFSPVVSIPLYDSNEQDLVMIKPLNRTSGPIQPARSFFRNN
jgi:hypothetical protein